MVIFVKVNYSNFNLISILKFFKQQRFSTNENVKTAIDAYCVVFVKNTFGDNCQKPNKNLLENIQLGFISNSFNFRFFLSGDHYFL